MHVHLAVHKLPEHAVHKGTKIEGWRLGTAVWRTVVGEDNGLCYVGGKNRNGNLKRKPIGQGEDGGLRLEVHHTKDYAEAEAASNRYSRSNGIPVGKPQSMRLGPRQPRGNHLPGVRMQGW